MKRGLIGTLIVGVVLAGCSQTASEPEPDPATELAMETDEPERDPATELAMEACSIEKVQDADPDSDEPTYTSFEASDGANWDAGDPLDEIEVRAEDWQDTATSAGAAAQLDDTWADLADMTNFQYLLVARIIDLRKKDGLRPSPAWMTRWPDFNDDVARYNQNLDSIENTCAALVKTLDVTG